MLFIISHTLNTYFFIHQSVQPSHNFVLAAGREIFSQIAFDLTFLNEILRGIVIKQRVCTLWINNQQKKHPTRCLSRFWISDFVGPLNNFELAVLHDLNRQLCTKWQISQIAWFISSQTAMTITCFDLSFRIVIVISCDDYMGIKRESSRRNAQITAINVGNKLRVTCKQKKAPRRDIIAHCYHNMKKIRALQKGKIRCNKLTGSG